MSTLDLPAAGGGPAVTTTIARVTGGVGGLAATYDRVLGLADRFDESASRMRDWALVGARTMSDPDLLESAPVSPLTFAEAQARVLEATTGTSGVLVDSVGWEADAVLVRLAVGALKETDDAVRAAFQVIDDQVDLVIGLGLVAAAPLLLVGGVALTHLPPRERAAATADLQHWVTHHPGAVEHVVDGGGGLLDGLLGGSAALGLAGLGILGPVGLPGFPVTVGGAAGDLAALYGPETTAVVTPAGWTVPGSDEVPGSVQDLIDHLAGVAGLSETPDSPANGTIQIQTVVAPDGSVHHIVYLPGTDDLTTLPWTQDGDVRDMATNLLLISGQDNAYQEGILQAMQDAGIRPGEPVLLVGHSQGGMEAAAILAHGSPYDITHVVTAGAPTAQVHGFPPGSHVLSLEHQGDVVPLLDGTPDPDSVQQVTVQFQDGNEGIVANHGYPHYSDGAAAVDASRDPSVVAAVHSLQHAGFLAPHGAAPGTVVTSQVFAITRGP